MRFLFPLIVLTLAACSGSGSGARTGSSRDLITAEEIKTISADNAYEAVQKLRPMFFSSRGPQSIHLTHANDPIVYLNETRYGDLESLKTIRADAVKEIKLIRPSDASIVYGPDHTGGVIAVKTLVR